MVLGEMVTPLLSTSHTSHTPYCTAYISILGIFFWVLFYVGFEVVLTMMVFGDMMIGRSGEGIKRVVVVKRDIE